MTNFYNRQSACNQRVVGLDLFRIALALLIFMFHSNIHMNCQYGILTRFVEIGAIAMTGFFMLSGYVLNLSYGKKDLTISSEIKTFYLKRLISILPLYYAWALFVIALQVVSNGTHIILEETILFPIEAFGIQSVFSTLFPYSHNGGSWFISCILICYFLFPLLQLLTKHLSEKCKIALIILLSAILLYSPIVQRYFHLQSIYDNPFFRLLEFTIGILVCQINTNNDTSNKLVLMLRKPIMCILSICAIVGGIIIARQIGIPRDYMLFDWIAIPCFISLLISLGSISFSRMQDSKMIQYLSALSFSFFLSQLHAVWYQVEKVMTYINSDSSIIKILLSLTICFCIANFFHFCIEKPASKYLKAKL